MELKAPFTSPNKDDKNEVTEENDAINRRKFLKTTGIMAGGVILGQSMILANNAEAALSAPSDIGVSHTASGSISFTWTAVTGAAGYKLYYGTSSGSYPYSVDLGNVTAKSYTNRSAGTYYMAFTAYATGTAAGRINESAKSTELIINFGVCVSLAATSAVIGNTVYFVWGAVTGASGYKLYYGTSSKNYSTGAVDLGDATSKSFSGVPRGIYYVALSTYTTSGEGGLSREIVITVP